MAILLLNQVAEVLFLLISVLEKKLVPTLTVALNGLSLLVAGLHLISFEKVLVRDIFFNSRLYASLGSMIGSTLLKRSETLEGGLNVLLLSMNHLMLCDFIFPSSLSIIYFIK